MEKPRVGVYRTVYPLYSEVFIAEQLRAYCDYDPLLICRELIKNVDGLEVATIAEEWRFIRRSLFTVLGCTSVFENLSATTKLDLVHAHFAQDAVMALPLARRLGVPLVVTCHGSDIMVSDKFLALSGRISNFRYLSSRGRLMRETSMFIAVSDFLRDAMIKRGFPADKIVRNYVGVDTTRFHPLPAREKNSIDGEYILSVARHEDVKGVDLLLKAFARVVRSRPNIRLVQIGGGSLSKELKDMAVRLGVERNINFLGPQPSSQVLRYIQSCIALVLPSRKAKTGAEEAFGLVLNEASACGIPCIGTRVGGIPEAVRHGDTGFIVDPESVEDLAEKISALISDRHLASVMGKRGREFVCDSFDIKKQTRRLEGIYRSLS